MKTILTFTAGYIAGVSFLLLAPSWVVGVILEMAAVGKP